MTINRSDIPNTSAPNFTAKMREAMMTYLGRQGDPLDRGLTLRDMVESGLVQLRNGFTLRNTSGTIPLQPGPNIGSEAIDLTPPPQPTGFFVSAGISFILVEHNHPTYTAGHGHLRTRLYGATWTSGPLPTFADAVEIGQFSANVYSHPTNPATTWHLWIKWESVDGVLSPTPAGGINGLSVTTGQDVSTLLDALTGKITASELNASLSTRIDLIDGAANVPGSVAAQVAGEAAIRAQAILDEAAARISADSTLQTQINTLSAASSGDLQDVLAAIQDEATARANADAAEAAARTTLATQVRGSYTGTDITQLSTGLLYEERLARSSADSSLASSISVVSATANAKNKTYLQPTAPTVGLVAGDVWYDSDDANKSYRWTGSLWEATADTRISANTAAIVSEQTARANGDSALATSISTLSSTVDANTAAISSEATTRASQTGELYAKYTVKIDVNGYVSGFGLASTANNGTPTSQFIFKADQFAFGAPGLTTAYPFVIQASATTANGVAVPAGVYIDAAYIKNGTITAAKIGNAVIDNAKISDLNAAKINAGTLSADRIAAGSITADKIDTRNLTVKDANGNILLGSGTALNWSNLTGQPTGIYNSNITISSSGQLSGAGGGQVTIGGLGYTGDLNATYGADFNSNVANRPSDDQFLNVLIDSTSWVPGQSPPWTTNGTQSQSEIVFGNGPRGAQVPLWECRSAGTNTANGGWNADSENGFTIDTSKTYRFVVPVRRTYGSSGTAYWGVKQSTVCNLNTTTTNTNPYFVTRAGTGMVIDRWYLMVGYVYPEGSVDLTHDGAGLYDMTTGKLVVAGTNYCWRPGMTSSGTRAYLYYSTSPLDRQQFAPPMVHVVNGFEPSITDLLDASAYLNENAAVGNNMLPNSDLLLSAGSWSIGWNQSGVADITVARDLAGSSWVPVGSHNIGISRSGTPTGVWDLANDALMAVVPGQRYEFSGRVACHRCTADIRVGFYTSNGTYISEFYTDASSSTGGTTLSGFTQLVGFAVAPSNAAYARYWVRSTANGSSNPYTWLVHGMFSLAGPNQTNPSPWSPSNFVEQITTTNVSTYIANGAIQDAHIGNIIQSVNYVAGSAGWRIDKTGQMEMNSATFRGTIDVKSSASGQRLEIKNNVIKVYDSSNVLRIRIGDLTA